MKEIVRHFTLLLCILLSFNFIARAQLSDGSIAPDWTLTDLDGNTHNLYDLLDQGKTVYLEFSATWCGPCWNFHNSGSLKNLYLQYGPGGTDEVMVFFIEADLGTNEACLYGPSGCVGGTHGDWVTGTPFPIINLTSTNGPSVPSQYQIAYYPTIYAVCPNGTIYESGQKQTAQQAEYINSCTFSMESIVGSTVDCYDSEDGNIFLEIESGTPPYSFRWSNGSTNQNLENVPLGEYEVTATEKNGVMFTATGIVEGPDAPVSLELVSKSDVNCAGMGDGFIEVEANGGTGDFTYVWSNGQTGPIAQGLSGGTYAVTVNDENNCEKVLEINIGEPEELITSATSEPATCEEANGRIDVTADGGMPPYLYDLGNGAQQQAYFTGLDVGSYSITITDTHGCESVESLDVDEVLPPIVVLPVEPLEMPCNGSTISIDGSESEYNPNCYFEWTTPNGNIVSGKYSLIAEVSSDGDYTLTIVDAITNCSRSGTVIVLPGTDYPVADAGPEKEISCNQSEITLDGGYSSTGNEYSYLWTTSNGNIVSGETTLTPVVDAVGVYKLTVTNDNKGCSATSSTTVSGDAELPEILIEKSGNIDCIVAEVVLDGTGSSRGANIEVSWTDSDGNELSDAYQVTVMNPGLYTFTVENIESGCKVSESLLVERNVDIPHIEIEEPDVLTCNETEIILNTEGSDRGTEYEYIWTTADGNIVGSPMVENVTVDAPGIYVLKILNNSSGCENMDTAIVTEFINTPEAIYTAETDELTVSFTNNSKGEFLEFLWDFGDGTTSTQKNPIHTYATDNTYTVCLTITNECGSDEMCEGIGVSASEIGVSSSVIHVRCHGGSDGSISITVDEEDPSGYEFEWSNGATTDSIGGLSIGDYTVTITSPTGTEEVKTYTINQPEPITIKSIEITNVSCYGKDDGVIAIEVEGGTAPYTYLWNNNKKTEINDTLSAGIYFVAITDANNCISIFDSMEVTQPEIISLVTEITNVTCYGESDGQITAEITGGVPPYNYEWDDNSDEPTLSGISAGTYRLVIKDSMACEKEFRGINVSQPDSMEVIDLDIFESPNSSAISLTVIGGTAPYTYKWSSGETTQNIYGLADGEYTLTVTDAQDCIAEFGPYKIEASPTGVNSIVGLSRFTIYPNPVNDVLQVSVKLNSNMITELELISNLGQVVYRNKYNGSEFMERIPVSELSSGAYFIRLVTADGIATETILISD